MESIQAIGSRVLSTGSPGMEVLLGRGDGA